MEHFNFLSPRYDRIIQPKEPQKLIAIADLPVEGTILDAGGGNGRIAHLFPYPNALARVETEDHNTWVIVDKSGD
jgi:hypothetical protein